MNILIVDDEAPARTRLRQLITDMGKDYEVVGEAANGWEALKQCSALLVDLVLLDIRMPGLDGLGTAARLAERTPPPAVIFVTAYEEHALQAFDRQAVDYLLKPVRRERLAIALQRARSLTRPQLQTLETLISEATTPIPAATEAKRQHLCVSIRGALLKLALDEIYYFRAEQKYVIARYTQGDVLLEESLKELEEEFPERFVRVHRNALVAREQIEALERITEGHYQIRLRDCPDRLEVSRRNLADLRRWLRLGTDTLPD